MILDLLTTEPRKAPEKWEPRHQIGFDQLSREMQQVVEKMDVIEQKVEYSNEVGEVQCKNIRIIGRVVVLLSIVLLVLEGKKIYEKAMSWVGLGDNSSPAAIIDMDANNQ